ncbi:hypothetical protein LTR62_006674 [Meristemomyces frigidus]|uniref:Nephrocystin 3-like N-terminal domain-containing protein n=1 Tax=Meristemomyces frigidus TaxID=1508187 RepID=A0AAN7TVM6_9PEZI|nr:hypothetical protein LTR62_006674 [Meristemomyces frigidus]
MGEQLSLTKHEEDSTPPYAILSHTWGKDDEELCFNDIKNGSGRNKAGFAKACFCGIWERSFRDSRWFTRGWTLQELLAPASVEFFSRGEDLLGDKKTLETLLHETTSIPCLALRGSELAPYSATERLRWAVKRHTTRKEDRAYCLQGLLGVYIAPHYGEGEYAFFRLQDEHNKKWNQLDYAMIEACMSNNTPGQKLSDLPATAMAISEDHRKALVALFWFENMGTRRETIKDAQSSTCEWLVSNPAYAAWDSNDQSDDHDTVLWINGKPGAGKSTLVKFADAHSNQHKKEDEIVISLFFNARGHMLEKSTEGVYRALLFHLLSEAPDLKHVQDGVKHDPSIRWPLHTLKILFSNAVAGLGERQLKCFIDALDECNEQQVRDMIEFIEDLNQHTPRTKGKVRICFVSRHYPTIAICRGQSLILENQGGHNEDLMLTIRPRLQAKNGKLVNEIRAQLLPKANGVFMWVVLVVDILNREILDGRIFEVNKRLQEIPSELTDLFRDILRRDMINIKDCQLCIQLVLFAKRPLSAREFYTAMELGLSGQYYEPKRWDPEMITMEDIRRFVSSSSKGLAELTNSKAPTVQLIHGSIRDFSIKNKGWRQLWPDLQGELGSWSHDLLKQCCSKYLSSKASTTLQHKHQSRYEVAQTDSYRSSELFDDVPLLRYATDSVFYHAEAAQRAGITQDAFLRSFPFRDWIQLHNLLYPSSQHGSKVTAKYILANLRCWDLLQVVLEHDKTFEKEDAEYGSCLGAAIAQNNTDVVQHLLSLGADPKIRCRNGKSLVKIACRTGYEKMLALLLRHGVTEDFLLLEASGSGDFGIVQVLIDNGADVSAQHVHDGNALQAASGGGHWEIAQLLIQKGANLNAQGGKHGSALQAALAERHGDIAQMLIERGRTWRS